MIPDAEGGYKVYNLQVKVNNSAPQSAKVIVYYPTEDWELNGNDDFSIFSGTAYTYSLDGEVESSVQYAKGLAGPCDPTPCPDCPPGGGTGSGGGTGGGGGPTRGGEPPGGGGPTGSGGPVVYPPFGPGSGNPSPGDTGTTGGGANCYWTCIYDANGDCSSMECIATNQNRLVNPCGGGGVVVAPQKTPCQKTKEMIDKPEVKQKINELKTQSQVGGEKSFRVKADGSTSAITTGGEHSVPLGDLPGYVGQYHNHTPRGIKIFSPVDISNLFTGIIALPASSVANTAFSGVIGSEPCSSCSGGYRYFHYVIRFTGTMQDAGTIYGTNYDFETLRKNFRKREKELSEDPQYVDFLGADLNAKGLEKLIFETLANMNIDKGKINLQRVNADGSVENINLDSNGKPIAVPCP